MDEFSKVLEEAEKLTGKHYSEIDTEFLVDLLLEMANNFKSSVVKWMATNIHHRLKLFYCPTAEPKNNWKRTVNRCVRDLNYKFKQDPSLKNWLISNFQDAWEMGLAEYRDSQFEWNDLPSVDLQECPWSFQELLTEL